MLTDEALPMSEKLHLISKEVRVGLTNGTLLGVIAFGVVTFYTMVLKHYPLPYSMAGRCLCCHCADAGYDHFQLCRYRHSHGIR